MAKYYFTYGLEGQPYQGGWTEVEAANRGVAVEAFCSLHPRKDGMVDCAWIYNESDFSETRMSKEGNFGRWCHERMCVTVEHLDGTEP